MPQRATVVLGDVVATGTSLQHAMNELIKAVQKNKSQLSSLIFFTIGGERSEEIFHQFDRRCRELFTEYESTTVVYFEGRFKVADINTDLFIKITGTDLLRLDSLMVPEFIQSQYDSPSYPLERCTIYDAGSRAFWLPGYFSDVKEYWESVLALSKEGVTFSRLLKQRFSSLDSEKYGEVSLSDICEKQIRKANDLIKC